VSERKNPFADEEPAPAPHVESLAVVVAREQMNSAHSSMNSLTAVEFAVDDFDSVSDSCELGLTPFVQLSSRDLVAQLAQERSRRHKQVL
jgi:hypothetical protein